MFHKNKTQETTENVPAAGVSSIFLPSCFIFPSGILSRNSRGTGNSEISDVRRFTVSPRMVLPQNVVSILALATAMQERGVTAAVSTRVPSGPQPPQQPSMTSSGDMPQQPSQAQRSIPPQRRPRGWEFIGSLDGLLASGHVQARILKSTPVCAVNGVQTSILKSTTGVNTGFRCSDWVIADVVTPRESPGSLRHHCQKGDQSSSGHPQPTTSIPMAPAAQLETPSAALFVPETSSINSFNSAYPFERPKRRPKLPSYLARPVSFAICILRGHLLGGKEHQVGTKCGAKLLQDTRTGGREGSCISHCRHRPQLPSALTPTASVTFPLAAAPFCLALLLSARNISPPPCTLFFIVPAFSGLRLVGLPLRPPFHIRGCTGTSPYRVIYDPGPNKITITGRLDLPVPRHDANAAVCLFNDRVDFPNDIGRLFSFSGLARPPREERKYRDRFEGIRGYPSVALLWGGVFPSARESTFHETRGPLDSTSRRHLSPQDGPTSESEIFATGFVPSCKKIIWGKGVQPEYPRVGSKTLEGSSCSKISGRRDGGTEGAQRVANVTAEVVVDGVFIAVAKVLSLTLLTENLVTIANQVVKVSSQPKEMKSKYVRFMIACSGESVSHQFRLSSASSGDF
ncbi:hypothetical protein AAG570_003733 [Ranatra chinensis]|uniref:Uncharacterized protein n=1 Tax=Ranatra chinensis TaxID=642074 RepID=A0ABD0Y4J3_9HEMI